VMMLTNTEMFLQEIFKFMTTLLVWFPTTLVWFRTSTDTTACQVVL
jgi:hypothetical protein